MRVFYVYHTFKLYRADGDKEWEKTVIWQICACRVLCLRENSTATTVHIIPLNIDTYNVLYSIYIII